MEKDLFMSCLSVFDALLGVLYYKYHIPFKRLILPSENIGIGLDL